MARIADLDSSPVSLPSPLSAQGCRPIGKKSSSSNKSNYNLKRPGPRSLQKSRTLVKATVLSWRKSSRKKQLVSS